jgi:hypothetical protein
MEARGLQAQTPGLHRRLDFITLQRDNNRGTQVSQSRETRGHAHYFIAEKSVGRMYVASIFSTVLLACSVLSTS